MGESIIKERRIHLAGGAEGRDLGGLLHSLGEIQGVVATRSNSDRDTVLVRYDLRKTTLERIEGIAKAAGFELSQSGWPRLKRAMVRFLETNELDNLGAPVSCCSEPPRHRGEG